MLFHVQTQCHGLHQVRPLAMWLPHHWTLLKLPVKEKPLSLTATLKKKQVTHSQIDNSQTVKICCTGVRLSKVLDSRGENELFFQNS